jgi:hypothetical protein
MSGVDELLGETSQSSSGYGIANLKMLLTTSVFQGSLEQNTEHYAYLKDEEDFSVWNQGLIATATKHHTHYVLDESYKPETDEDIWEFEEVQAFMYNVFEDHLKTNKG